MAVSLEEEDFTIASSCHKHGLRRSVGQLDNWGIVGLEHNVQLDVLLVDVDHADDTRVVADSGNTTTVVVRAANEVDT